MTSGPAATAFLELRRTHKFLVFSPETALPAQREDIERELFAAHTEASTDDERRECRDALMDLATFVPDEAAALLNAGFAKRLGPMSSAQTASMSEAADAAVWRQKFVGIRLHEDNEKVPLEEFMDRKLEGQKGDLMQNYGSVGTYGWIAACLYKVVTANGLATGLAGIAYFFVGMFIAAVVSGIPFYLLHRGVVRVLPKDHVPAWVPWLGLAQRLLQFATVFIVCSVLFDRIFGR